MPSVRVGDIDVAYEVQGSGDPFVLVHGSTGGRGHWLQVAPALAERYTVITPEYAGGGESTTPAGPLEIDDLVAQMFGAADAAGASGAFHLAGWSLGAVVATAMAAAQPDRVRTLTVINGWAKSDARQRFTFDLWQRLLDDPELFGRYALADGLTVGSFEAFGDGIEAMIPMMSSTLAPGSKLHAELDARIDIEGRLGAITSPTLIVGGMQDRWVDITHSRAMAEAITDARIEELECGHLIPTEKAAELTALLLEHADRV